MNRYAHLLALREMAIEQGQPEVAGVMERTTYRHAFEDFHAGRVALDCSDYDTNTREEN